MPTIRTGLVVACSALIAVSCGTIGQSADADMTTSSPSTAAAAADVLLVDLRDADEVARWTTVNDPVMGGKSTSRIRFAKSGLVFSGTISLENNGGFASARGPQNPEIGRRATDAGSLRVSAVGDEKTYLLKVGEAGQSWSYIQRFATEPGVGRSYDLPVSGFEPVGQRLDPEPNAPATLDPSTINQVSLYILDKQQGPFEITVSAIDAVF